MAGIEKVNQNYKTPFLTAKNTGYAALGGLCLTTISAAVKPAKKAHIPLGIITLGLSFLHLMTILNYKHAKKSENNFIA